MGRSSGYRPPSVVRFLLVLLLIVASVAGTGCREREDLAGDTVRVTLPDRTVELEVISCGLDDDVFVLGASAADAFVQVLLTTTGDAGDEDGEGAVDVDVSSSAFSVDIAGEGVLGAGSAALLQVRPGTSGPITRASIRGDRIELEADTRRIDGGSDGDGTSVVTPVVIEARCPAVEDFV